MTDPIVRKASETTTKEVVSHLPTEGQTSSGIGTAAFIVQIVNGLDMLLTFAGIVPPGTIPTVVNGVVAIGAGVAQWWAKRKTVKIAYFTPPNGPR